MKCKIQINNKQATLKVSKLVLYQHCQLLLAQGRSGNDYYLIFHKKRYINTVKIDELKADSFIAKAIQNGLSVLAPHHAIHSLVADQTFTLTPLKKMLYIDSNSDKQLDQIIILSYFDQYVSKEKISEHFIEVFRHHRRNGQMQLAFQVVSLLKNYDPENQFAFDILSSLTFQDYQLNDLEYFSFNPLQLEHLEHIYQSENRQFELSILSTFQIINDFSEHYWSIFIQTLNAYPKQIKTDTLAKLFKQQPDLIKESLFVDALLNDMNSQSYLKVVLNKKFIHSIDFKPFFEHLQNAKEDLLLMIFQEKKVNLKNRINPFTAIEKENIVRVIVEAALKSEPIDTILAWLDEFDQPFSFEKQLLLIQHLLENPDQQEQLADLYQKFNHYEGAIDCLKWDLELDPTNEVVFKKLIHLLKETNNTEEVEAYQQQWIQQMKYSD